MNVRNQRGAVFSLLRNLQTANTGMAFTDTTNSLMFIAKYKMPNLPAEKFQTE